jgi:two-component sensor histidine kinase
VAWDTISDERGEALALTWSDAGGPVVRPPDRRGFGSTLVEHALPGEFAGEARITFAPQGVVCTMRLPLSDRLTIGRHAA